MRTRTNLHHTGKVRLHGLALTLLLLTLGCDDKHLNNNVPTQPDGGPQDTSLFDTTNIDHSEHDATQDSAQRCPNRCAPPQHHCQGDEAIDYTGPGACLPTGECDFSAVQVRETCSTFCAGGLCVPDESTLTCSGVDDCRPGSFCDPQTNFCASGCDEATDCSADTPICDFDTNTCLYDCQPDRLEPNDEPTQASPLPIQLGTAYRERQLELCDGDVDWFRLDADVNLTLTLQVTQLRGSGSVRAAVISSNSVELVSGPGGQDLQAELEPGQNLIVVETMEPSEVVYVLSFLLEER